VKRDGETFLAEAIDFFRFTEQLRACRDQQVLAVVGIDVGGE
jgi:hypothetical protein